MIYISFLLENFSNRKYYDDLSQGGQGRMYLVLLAYCIISFFWTRKTLASEYNIWQWVLSWIIDFLILPLSVLLVILYHNHSSLPGLRNLSSVENFLLIWILMAFKHIFFNIAKGNLSFGSGNKRKSNSVN
jgi:hypothetical protein